MKLIEQWVIEKLAPLKKELKYSFLFTFLWGLAAHGYMFLSNSISHDSLDEFIALSDTAAKKIGSGRFLLPLIYWLRGSISAPWWLGLLSLICISLSVFLIVRMFKIQEGWMICLAAGFLTVNISYIALAATYIHDLDADSLALLLAVLAAYQWRTQKRGALYGILPLTLSLGIYQSFLSVTITLVVIASILDLLHEKDFRTVFLSGLKAVGMILAGGIVYYILLILVSNLRDISVNTERYNSLGNILKLTPSMILKLTLETWFTTFKGIINVVSGLPRRLSQLTQCGVILICLGILAQAVFGKRLGKAEKLLLIILFLVLPVGVDVSRILSGGMSHDLMHYGYWLLYLLALLLTREMVQQNQDIKAQIVQILATILIAVTVVSNVQTANVVYTGKRFIQDGNLSLFTRILSDIEDQEGYIPGETPISFQGWPDGVIENLPPQYRKYYVTGFMDSYVIGSAIPDHYQCYFTYVLMNPGLIASSDLTWRLYETEEVQTMPVYPAPGSVAMVDGTMVVKLSN